MSVNGVLKLSKYKYIIATILSVMLGSIDMKPAHALTGNDVLHKMKAVERHAFLSGLVEGLGYARFLRDKRDNSGSKCIYDWYFKDKETNRPKIQKWFERHPDKPASTLLYVLLKRDCGA
ncbi:MAG: hypothetical protein OIF54_00540 [Cohaesibacter sp.]|nr:hypothetical protein [Cohaesibacter sp.]